MKIYFRTLVYIGDDKAIAEAVARRAIKQSKHLPNYCILEAMVGEQPTTVEFDHFALNQLINLTAQRYVSPLGQLAQTTDPPKFLEIMMKKVHRGGVQDGVLKEQLILWEELKALKASMSEAEYSRMPQAFFDLEARYSAYVQAYSVEMARKANENTAGIDDSNSSTLTSPL